MVKEHEIKAIMSKHLPKGKNTKAVIGWFAGDEENYISTGDFGGVRPEKANFQIGSITKLFTGTLAGIYIERGKLSLDKKVGDYIDIDTKSSINHILVKDLLTHYSGLPSAPRELFKMGYDKKNPYNHITKDLLFSFMNSYHKKPSEKKSFGYSNLGFGIMGQILEELSGKSYESLLLDEICTPLKLYNTWITPPSDAHLIPGTIKGKNETPRWILKSMEAAGALDSSAADMLNFARANLDNHPFYPHCQLCHNIIYSINTNLNMGLSWIISKDKNLGMLHSHNGGTGGFNSFLAISPEKKIGIVALVNSGMTMLQGLGLAQDYATKAGYLSMKLIKN